jgi:hypothetical protein
MIQVNFTTFELDSRTKEWIERRVAQLLAGVWLCFRIALDGFGGCLLLGAIRREHHRKARDGGAVVYFDLTRTQASLELLAAHAQVLACLFIDSLHPFLGVQLTDLIVSSGSHWEAPWRSRSRESAP